MVARLGVRALVVLAPDGIPRLDQVSVDGRVLLVACVTGLVTALVVGLVPGLSLVMASPGQLLGSGSSRVTRRYEQWTLRSLVAVQVALSCMLLVGTALLAQTLWRLSAVDPGFEASRLVLVGLG